MNIIICLCLFDNQKFKLLAHGAREPLTWVNSTPLRSTEEKTIFQKEIKSRTMCVRDVE